MSQKPRPPMAVAMERVSQVTTIGGEMVFPAVAGYFLDRRWGTDPWLLIGGAVLGITLSVWHMYQLAAKSSRDNRPTSKPRSK
ncbi:MAG: AtpZ/AtpI family protein [Planctomycetaceae bacterium]|nr:AtpZ/AtpI family protein [Planctomycetaceae bacterium]